MAVAAALSTKARPYPFALHAPYFETLRRRNLTQAQVARRMGQTDRHKIETVTSQKQTGQMSYAPRACSVT